MNGPARHIAACSEAGPTCNMRPPHLLFVRLSVLLCLLIGPAGCENDLAEVQHLSASEDDLNKEVASQVNLIYSDSAIVRVMVESPLMIRYTDKNNPRQEFPEGLSVHFYAPNLQETSTLTAGYGLRLEREKRVILRDSVVWRSIQAEQLETEELIWDEKNKRIYTDKFVVIHRPSEIIYGYGFEATQDFEQAHIKAVEGRIKVKQPPMPDSKAPAH